LNNNSGVGLNPTSALPFPSSFKSRQLSKYSNNNDKYSKINNKSNNRINKSITTNDMYQITSAAVTSTATASSSTLLNRNKNPAYSNAYTNGYNSRFSFYNNTNLLNSRTNESTTNRNLNLLTQQLTTPTAAATVVPQTAKSNHLKSAAILTANLNNKAREELLEKRKKKANETSLTSDLNKKKSEFDESDTKIDNTPAIPITSYSSYKDDEEDEEEDEESENKSIETQNVEINPVKITIDLKKRKLDILKNDTINNSKVNKKKTKSENNNKNNSENEDEEDEEEENSYFNIFKSNSEQTTATTTSSKKSRVASSSVNKIKLAIKKQPIIKAGQTQKDREEINTLFIGKKNCIHLKKFLLFYIFTFFRS
jgi:hypothetical protein